MNFQAYLRHWSSSLQSVLKQSTLSGLLTLSVLLLNVMHFAKEAWSKLFDLELSSHCHVLGFWFFRCRIHAEGTQCWNTNHHLQRTELRVQESLASMEAGELIASEAVLMVLMLCNEPRPKME